MLSISALRLALVLSLGVGHYCEARPQQVRKGPALPPDAVLMRPLDPNVYANQLVNATYIRTPEITNWGNWASGFDVCPENTFPKGVSAYYEPNQYNDDDTAMNTLEMYCGSLGEEVVAAEGRIITSLRGPFQTAHTSNYWCPGDGFIVGLEAKIEGPINGDDTSLNKVRFLCSNGAIVPPPGVDGSINGIGGTDWGEWRGMQHCPSGYVAKAISTEVEPEQGYWGDDTALNNIKIACVKPTIDGNPVDLYSLIMSCANGKNAVGGKCSYQYSIGTSLETTMSSGHSEQLAWSLSLGAEVGAEVRSALSAKFTATSTWTATTKYDWSKSQSTIEKESKTFTVTTGDLCPGWVNEIWQVQGTCGRAFKVYTPYFIQKRVPAGLHDLLLSIGEDALRSYAFTLPDVEDGEGCPTLPLAP